jgi:hypothetical protein
MITDEQKTTINEIISASNSMVSRIGKGVVLAKESSDFFSTNIHSALALFDQSSDEWRTIDRWKNENGYNWTNQPKSGSYANDRDKEKIEKLIAILSALVGGNNVKIEKNEWHFSISETYDAKRFICDIFRTAGAKIIIIDEHLDDQFFEYVDIVPDTIQIKIITGEQKTIFWTLLVALKNKRKNIEARVNGISHCRYVVIDDSVVYSTDASLNTIGKKDFMVHKLKDEKEITKVKAEIEGYWNNAKIK